MESTHEIKDRILADAIKTAIETEKKCRKMMIMISLMAVVICGLLIIIVGG